MRSTCYSEVFFNRETFVSNKKKKNPGEAVENTT